MHFNRLLLLLHTNHHIVWCLNHRLNREVADKAHTKRNNKWRLLVFKYHFFSLATANAKFLCATIIKIIKYWKKKFVKWYWTEGEKERKRVTIMTNNSSGLGYLFVRMWETKIYQLVPNKFKESKRIWSQVMSCE